MATDQTLRAIITVLDRTAEPIHAINARFHAMASPLHEIGSRLGEFSEEVGLVRVGEHASEALERVRGLGEKLTELAGPLAALGAAGSLAGLVEITKGAAEFAEQLDIGARMTGIASEQLSGWHYAAGLANIDVERLDRAFAFLGHNIPDAAVGKAKDLQSILSHMGFHNTPGHLVSMATALKGVAAEAKYLVDHGQVEVAQNMMAKLFGTRTGAQLLPIFEKGPEELAKTLKDAQDAGIALTSSQTAAGREFMDQYKAMSASVEGLKVAIGDKLLPILTPLVEQTRDWLNADRAHYAKEIGDGVKYLVDTLKQAPWKDIGNDLKAIGEDAKSVIDAIGGIGPAALLVATISFAPTIKAFTDLTGGIAAATAKLLLFPAASFIATAATMVPAIKSLKDAFAAMSLAADANPIGALVAAGVALGFAAYEIYDHWAWLVKKFEWVWDQIARLFEAGWHKIEPIVKGLEDAAHWFGHVTGLDAKPPTTPGQQFDTSAAYTGFVMQPSLLSQPGAATAAVGAPAPAQQGSIKMTVDMTGVPLGTAVKTEARGNVTPPDVNVGYAWMPN